MTAPLRGEQKLLVVLLMIACFGTTSMVVLSVVKQQSTPKPAEDSQAETDQLPDKAPVLTGSSDDAERKGLRVLANVPAFEMTDKDFSRFGTKQLKGKVWITNFIFTRCPTICPRMTSSMAEVQFRLMQSAIFDEVKLVSITVDPEHDTPEVLAARADIAQMHSDNWHWLTEGHEMIWSLIKDGFHLPVAENTPEAEMPIMHSQKFVLVDRQLRIRGYYDGLSEEGTKNLLRDIFELVKEPAPQVEEIADPPTLETPRKPESVSIADQPEDDANDAE